MPSREAASAGGRMHQTDAMIEATRTEQGITVTLTEDELVMINNALNEVCHGLRIDDRELRIRTGFSRQEMVALLDRLRVLRQSRGSEEAQPG